MTYRLYFGQFTCYLTRTKFARFCTILCYPTHRAQIHCGIDTTDSNIIHAFCFRMIKNELNF